MSAACLDYARHVVFKRIGQSVLLDRRVLAVADFEVSGINARGLEIGLMAAFIARITLIENAPMPQVSDFEKALDMCGAEPTLVIQQGIRVGR